MSSTPFRLQGLSNSFMLKADSVFGSLTTLEKEHNDWAKTAGKDEPSPQKEEPTTLRDSEFSIPRSKTQLDRRGQSRDLREKLIKAADQRDERNGEGQFRRPQGLPPPRRTPKVPDFRLHPERWMKYSLDSTPHTSEAGNRAAAMSFLNERADSSQDEQEIREQDGHSFRERDSKNHRPPAPINFNKRSRRIETDEATDVVRQREPGAKSQARGTPASVAPCHVMPEHVVGSSRNLSQTSKQRAPMGPKTGLGDRVNLSYLAQIDDDADNHPEKMQVDETDVQNDEADSSAASSSADNSDKDGESKTVPNRSSETRADVATSINSETTIVKRRKFRGNTRTRNLDDDDG